MSDLGDKLSDVLDEVSTTGTEYVITRHGRPVAVMLGYDEYESLIETVNVLSDTDTMSAIGEADAELATGRLCTICGQPSGRAAECWACFVAGDDAYRRAADR